MSMYIKKFEENPDKYLKYYDRSTDTASIHWKYDYRYDSALEALKNPDILLAVKNDLKEEFPNLYNEGIGFGREIINYEKYNKYIKNAFPAYTQFVKDNKLEQKNAKNKRMNQGNIGGLLHGTKEAIIGMYNSVGDKFTEQALVLANAIGVRNIEGIGDIHNEIMDINAIENISRDAGIISTPGYYTGKKAIIDGITYIKNERGQIFDATNDIILTDVEVDEYEKINKALEASKETGSGYSIRGGTTQLAAVTAGVLYDVAAMYGGRQALVKVGVSKAVGTSLVRQGLKSSTVRMALPMMNTMGYYTFAGYANGYKEIYNQSITAGLSADVAAELAKEGAAMQGAWWGATSFFIPTNLYMRAGDKLFGFNKAVGRGIQAYNSGGKGAYAGYWKNYYSKLSPGGQNAMSKIYSFGRAGFGETGQEITQEVGTRKGIYSYLNKKINRNAFNDKFTFEDFVNTFYLSFLAGGQVGVIGAGGLNTNAETQVGDLFRLGENLDKSSKLIYQAVDNGDISKAKADKLLNDAKAVFYHANKIPSFVGMENVVEVANILQEVAKKKNLKKSSDKVFHEDLDEEINNLNQQITVILAESLDKGSAKIMEQLGYGFEVFDNQGDASGAIETLIEAGGKVDQENSTDYGTFVVMPDGKVQVVVNQESAKDHYNFTTGQHETFHGLIFNIVKNNPEAAKKLGLSLIQELKTNKNITFHDNVFALRFKQYLNDPKQTDANILEELMPLLSEGLTAGHIKFTEDTGTKIGDFFRRALRAVGFNARFTGGKDVLNLVRDFNLAVESKKGLSRGLRKIGAGKADIDIDIDTTLDRDMDLTDVMVEEDTEAPAPDAEETLDITETVEPKPTPTESKSSKRLTELVTEYKTNPGEVNVMELLTQYNKAGKDAIKRWNGARKVPINLGNPQVNEEVEGLLRAEFDSFTRNFDPSISEATTYLNQIAKRIGPKLVEEHARVSKQSDLDIVLPDTVEQPDLDTKTDQDIGRKKMTVTNNRVIQESVSPQARNQIKEDSKSTIVTLASKGATSSEVVNALDTEAKSETFKQVKGKKTLASQTYKDFINNLFNSNFVKAISVADMKSRFPGLFNVKQTGTTPTTSISPKTGKKGIYNKQVFSVKAPTTKAIKDYFLGYEGKGFTAKQKSKYVKRAESLFNLISKDIALESLPELKNDPDFMELLQTSLENNNSPFTAEQFMAEIDQKLDRRNLEDTSLDKVKASKRMSPTTLIGIASDKTIDGIMKRLKINKIELNTPEKVKEVQGKILEYIEEYGITSNTFIGAKFSNSGRLHHTRNGIIYYTLKNGTEVKENSEGYKLAEKENLFQPARFRVYYGKKDPAYQTALKAAKKNDKLDKRAANSKVTLSGKIVTKAWLNTKRGKQPSRLEKFENNMDVLEDSSLELQRAVNRKDNPMPMDYATLFITQGYQATSGMIKTAAQFRYVYSDLKPGEEFREEHNPPASVIGGSLIYAIQKGTVKSAMKDIRENYYQTQIPKWMDVLINNAGFQSILPEGGSILNNSVIRLAAVGNKDNQYILNLNKFINPITGETLAEEAGLSLETKFQNPDMIHLQNELLLKVYLSKDIDIKTAKTELDVSKKVNTKSSKRVEVNRDTLFGLIDGNNTTEASIKTMSDADVTASKARTLNPPKKGISVFDFDDTLAKTKEKVTVYMPYYAPGSTTEATMELTPAEFAEQAQDLESMGASFDFSQFEDVKGAKKGPLADIALKRQGKFGSGDIFVLTARPQISALGIQTFLNGIGLKIPIKNITGLENGTPQAKARWVLSKTAEGYNDFYFADDALPNVHAVQNILDQVDVKSKVQQAKSSKRINLNKEFNTIIEQQSGKAWYKTYYTARAKTTGRTVNTFEFFIPPSAEDFSGLLHKILPKGEKGNLAKKWFKDNLYNPFNKAEQEIIESKMTVANDFAALRKNINNIPKNLNKEIGVGNFTFSQALRVYIWNMQGMEIPGLSIKDKNALIKAVEKNADHKVFAEKIAFIQKGKNYPAPQNNWIAGNITTDIIQDLNKRGRKEALQEWQENVDIIFSEENINKLEAIYGSNWVVALKNSLRRMKSGSNRPVGMNAQVNNIVDWLNNSVGAVMFLNTKSAMLQLISSINFINWTDNNIAAAAQAFASKNYWPTVMKLLNSDYLVQRRNGLKINVAESEIAEAAHKGGFKGAIAYILNKGFIFTRVADSFAIATGGATFFINRTKALQKQINLETGKLYTKKEAEAKAFEDFYQISEESQQSSRTDRISLQQASGIGRVILNFANTPMQYARIIKKSTADLLAGRGDWKSNLSKITYYGIVQNLIFNAMQATIFALAFGDEEEERRSEDKVANIANGMVDSLLRGLGYGGAAIATVKDVIIKINKEHQKKTPAYQSAVDEVFNFSPAIDSKVRKMRSSLKTFSWNKKEMARRGFNLDNPAYLAIGQIVSATTNLPLDRALRLIMNMRQASDKETEIWQKVALMFGYSGWQLGLPYWGLPTTVKNEVQEEETIKKQYKNDSRKLKTQGYKRIPMTKGKPEGKLNIDYIEVARPTGATEYWLMPKNKKK